MKTILIILLFFITYMLISKRNPLSMLAIGRYKKDIFDQQAEQRDGAVKISESDGAPSLLFPHEDKEIKVYVIPGGKRPGSMHLNCTIDSGGDQSFFVYRKTFAFDGGLFQATHDSIIQTLNPAFNKLFIVESNDEEIVNRILTPEIQQYFIDQKRHRPVAYVKEDKLDFSILGKPKDDLQLNLFIETGLAIKSLLDIDRVEIIDSIDNTKKT